jgi:esterase/lipase superfamily enzyme
LLNITELDALTFWGKLNSSFEKLTVDKRIAMVYIHGFNSTFEGAAIRAAQFACDLGIEGQTAFYSWPSKGTILGYEADGASVEASEDFIAEFLASFASKSGASQVHVIAHSMGNRGLLRAIHRILGQAQQASNVQFGQIVLAAPDVDTDLFLKLADGYPKISERTTLYICDKDKALMGSGILHDFPRAGFTPPVTVAAGIDTVEVSNVDLTWLGHGFVAESREVLHDMHELLTHNAPPWKRFGLRRGFTPDEHAIYWIINS